MKWKQMNKEEKQTMSFYLFMAAGAAVGVTILGLRFLGYF